MKGAKYRPEVILCAFTGAVTSASYMESMNSCTASEDAFSAAWGPDGEFNYGQIVKIVFISYV